MIWKFKEGQEVTIIDASDAELIGTTHTVVRQRQIITQKDGTGGILVGDWIVVPGYELEGLWGSFKETKLALYNYEKITVTDNEFDDLFG